MSLNFGTKERFRDLKTVLEKAGYKFRIRNGIQVYKLANEAAMQSIIDAYDPIVNLKELKIEELKAEGLKRVQLTFPAIKDFDEIALIRENWLSIAPAARNPTVKFQSLIDKYQAGKSAATVINSLATVNAIEAYDVVNTPSWP